MEPTPVQVLNWPGTQAVTIENAPPGTFEVVTLPTGATLRIDYTATFGDLFVGVAILLGVVTALGGRLIDRIRGVL